jgi:carbon-monoxide dehydrogenase small subunit
MNKEITFNLNGSETTVPAAGEMRLLDLLRGPLRHTGTKEGCGEGECGACTVLVDGLAVNACLFPALEIEGKSVITIEGLLAADSKMSFLQDAFVNEGGIQCGFCSPGMILSTKALLDVNPDPTDREIRDALVGNLCRCTGYVQIIDAVKAAARKLKETR